MALACTKYGQLTNGAYLFRVGTALFGQEREKESELEREREKERERESYSTSQDKES